MRASPNWPLKTSHSFIQYLKQVFIVKLLFDWCTWIHLYMCDILMIPCRWYCCHKRIIDGVPTIKPPHSIRTVQHLSIQTEPVIDQSKVLHQMQSGKQSSLRVVWILQSMIRRSYVDLKSCMMKYQKHA